MNLEGLEVDEDVVVVVDGVGVGVRGLASALEVFAADQTGVDIDVGERDGAEPLKVKVEHGAVDLRESDLRSWSPERTHT